MRHLAFIPDVSLLFATRMTRLFAYGFLSVVLVLYLVQLGLHEAQVGLLLTLTLLGDTLISLWITVNADRLGRRSMLLVGAGLMLLAGIVFALTSDFVILLIAATIGVISPSGNEVGPFLAIEQASLAQVIREKQRTTLFAWYNLAGSTATALGSLCVGMLTLAMSNAGTTPLTSYRVVVLGYAILGGVLGLLFTRLSPQIEIPQGAPIATGRSRLGLHRSRRTVLGLAGLFSLDAFGGGFVVQSIVAYWFHLRFGVEPAMLGGIFFGANLLAGLSSLLAARLAARIGLINTMVFTHLPSNILLICVPLMPTLPLAVAVLFVRFSISQMDVPTRQSYTIAVVDPDERSAAAGLTGIARTTGAAVSPIIAGTLMANPMLVSVPFFLAGSLKIIYDLLLFLRFRSLKPPAEVDTSLHR